jgi:hypothetical protein
LSGEESTWKGGRVGEGVSERYKINLKVKRITLKSLHCLTYGNSFSNIFLSSIFQGFFSTGFDP